MSVEKDSMNPNYAIARKKVEVHYSHSVWAKSDVFNEGSPKSDFVIHFKSKF